MTYFFRRRDRTCFPRRRDRTYFFRRDRTHFLFLLQVSSNNDIFSQQAKIRPLP